MKVAGKIWFLILAIFFILSFFEFACAEGIRVSPGAFCIKNVNIGKNLNLGIDLIITNGADEEQEFVIKTLKPSEVKKNWIKGYTEIPDPNWFYYEKDTISIPANSTGKTRMYLNIPDEEKYYNQCWMVYALVTTKTAQGSMFKMAIKPNYSIETVSKADISERPHGILGLVPGILTIENRQKALFKIYNNDTVKHEYVVGSYIPKQSFSKQSITLSSGYEWVKNTNWVTLSHTKVLINPGEIKEVEVKVEVPEKERALDPGWESIIMVEQDQGLPRFVRILISTKQ